MAIVVDSTDLDVGNRELNGNFPGAFDRAIVVRKHDTENPTKGLLIFLAKIVPTQTGVGFSVTAGVNDIKIFDASSGRADATRTKTNDRSIASFSPTLGQLIASQSLSELLGAGRTPAYAGEVNGGLLGGLSLSTELANDAGPHAWPIDGTTGTWVVWGVFFGSDFTDSFRWEYGRTA